MYQLLNRIVRPFGLRVASVSDTDIGADHSPMVYQHKYNGGYEEYRSTQIFHNKRKLENVWADDFTLAAIASDLEAHNLGRTGVCHGARNGYEVEWFRNALGGDIIGTDISETANNFPNMHVWDFQDDNPDWANKFDFIYSNSLDQAMEPQRALASWTKQLTPDGRIYIEHTMAHSPTNAGEMDPFGAHPMAMPYLFFIWGRSLYKLVDIIEIGAKKNNKMKAWIFVLKRA